jgi:hypothetical protein
VAQIPFWDALIVASAEQADATHLYGVDVNSGQTIAGVKIVNPLVAAQWFGSVPTVPPSHSDAAGRISIGQSGFFRRE